MPDLTHIRSLRRWTLTCLALISVAMLPAWADDTSKQQAQMDSLLRLLEIDEVQVIGYRRHDESLIPVQRLEGATLEGLSTSSVADAVRFFAGVQIKDYGGVGGMKTVDVRSMGTHHLGVFYDGIEIGNAQNGTVDLGKFSMDNIEEIALYNGQKPEIFQAAKDFGSAGTLYLRTRQPKFDSDKSYNVEVRMRAGTFGLANPSLLYEQRLTSKLYLSANAEYTYATGRYHFRYRMYNQNQTLAWDTTGVRTNGEVQSGRGEIGLFGALPDGKWHVKGYYYQSSRGIPCAIVRNHWSNQEHQWDRNAFVQGHWEQSWDIGKRRAEPMRLSVQTNAKYSNDYLRYLNPDTQSSKYIDNRYLHQEVYLSAASKLSVLSWLDVSLAADWQWNTLSSDMANFAFPTRNTLLVAAATDMHYRWIRGQLSLLETYVHDAYTAGGKPQQSARQRLTPAAFVGYQPVLSLPLYLRAFYKQIYRMPTFNDLYYAEVGNSYLEPEYTHQVNLGAEYRGTPSRPHTNTWNYQLLLKGDLYFNKVQNKIVAIPKGNSQYRWMMMNIGEVHIYGAEAKAGITFMLNQQSRKDEVRLDLIASYCYQRAMDMTDPADNDPYFGTYKSQIAYIPRHSGNVNATVSWRLWNLTYAFVYVGERYTGSANIQENYVLPWYTHDVSLSKIWTLPLHSSSRRTTPVRLQTALEINNMLNQHYEVIINYPMPGINGKMTLKVLL